MDIQGEGEFLIAQNQGVGTIIFRNPDTTREDLIIRPRQGVVVEDLWLKVPHFVRSATQGKIALSRSDKVPDVMEIEVSSEYEGKLNPTLKHLIITIATCKLETNGTLAPQFLSAIHIGDLLNESGMPKTREVSVTPEYLQTQHSVFLKALRELEVRYQNRIVVLKEIDRALSRIRELA